jgi:hypothetical protein
VLPCWLEISIAQERLFIASLIKKAIKTHPKVLKSQVTPGLR